MILSTVSQTQLGAGLVCMSTGCRRCCTEVVDGCCAQCCLLRLCWWCRPLLASSPSALIVSWPGDQRAAWFVCILVPRTLLTTLLDKLLPLWALGHMASHMCCKVMLRASFLMESWTHGSSISCQGV